jgi:hypothetical protein
MRNKKLKKTGLLSALLVSALLLITTPVYAQGDAGPPTDAIAAVAATESAPVATEPAEPAAEEDVAEAEKPEAIAVAEPTEESATGLHNLSTALMDILIPVFVTLIGGLCAMLLAWVRKKLKLDVSDTQIRQWSDYAEIGAARAGEWARNNGKELSDGEKIPGPDVMDVAVNFAVELARENNLPEMGRDKLEGLIESKLFKGRASA